ncbi:MAG: helix-turn-helix domain-containing protein [Actinobacteria bacterium]|nr:helix-turn-helix domain-containing protein [Actinomycetota bacterium]
MPFLFFVGVQKDWVSLSVTLFSFAAIDTGGQRSHHHHFGFPGVHMHTSRDRIVITMQPPTDQYPPHAAAPSANPAAIPTSPSDGLTRAVKACLDDIPRLVQAWFALLLDIPTYQQGLVDADTVRRECTLVFVRLLSEIGGLPMPPEARSVSERVGHSRAIRGIPLSELLTAIRLDYRVLWEGLLAHLDQQDPHAIADSVPRLLDAVEQHSQEVTKAYTLTQYGLTQARKDENRLWFTRLMETDGQNQVLNIRACEVLGLKPHQAFSVFVPSRRSGETLELLNSELRRRSIVSHHYAIEGGDVLLTQLTVAQQADISGWISERGAAIALGPVEGISVVPCAVRLLHALSAQVIASNRGVERGESHWPLAVFCAPEEARRLLRHRYIEPLLSLPDAKRAALTETADVFLRNGSIADTARTLFCHRNTVTNRLHDLSALTDLDVRLPTDAATYLLAAASA